MAIRWHNFLLSRDKSIQHKHEVMFRRLYPTCSQGSWTLSTEGAEHSGGALRMKSFEKYTQLQTRHIIYIYIYIKHKVSLIESSKIMSRKTCSEATLSEKNIWSYELKMTTGCQARSKVFSQRDSTRRTRVDWRLLRQHNTKGPTEIQSRRSKTPQAVTPTDSSYILTNFSIAKI